MRIRQIKQNILNEKEKSVTSYFNQPFIKHVCLNKKWTLDTYEDMPIELIEEVFKELGSETGIQYDTKLYSLFSELCAYKNLVSQGYSLSQIVRSSGSCDLILDKDGLTYNCEVKQKKSKDVQSSNILFFVQGKSWLPSYKDLRDLHQVYYRIIQHPNSYSDTKKMYDEIDIFCKSPHVLYEGVYIHLSSKKFIRGEPSDYIISQHTQESTKGLIEKILTGENRHLTKLIEKSKKFDNFIGYISLDIPFHDEVNQYDLEKVLNSLGLGFKLYVDVNGIGIEKPYLLEIN